VRGAVTDPENVRDRAGMRTTPGRGHLRQRYPSDKRRCAVGPQFAAAAQGMVMPGGVHAIRLRLPATSSSGREPVQDGAGGMAPAGGGGHGRSWPWPQSRGTAGKTGRAPSGGRAEACQLGAEQPRHHRDRPRGVLAAARGTPTRRSYCASATRAATHQSPAPPAASGGRHPRYGTASPVTGSPGPQRGDRADNWWGGVRWPARYAGELRDSAPSVTVTVRTAIYYF